MNFRRWVVFSFAIHVLVIVIDKGAGLVLTTLLAGHADLKGVADLFTTVPFILMAVANLGLATSLVYFVRRHGEDVQKVAETTSLVAIVWGGTVALLGIVVVLWLVPLVKPDWSVDPWLVVPVCLCVPFLLLSSYYNSIQLATERVRDYNLVHLLTSFLFLPLFLLFYWLGGGPPAAAQGVVFGRLGVAVIVTVVVLWMLRNLVRLRPRLHGDFLRRGLAYGWRANITSVLTYLNHRIDLLLLPLLYIVPTTSEAKAEVAFYSLAVTFAELVWHFPEALRDLFFSKVAGETHERARQLTPVLCRICLAFAVFGSLIVAGMVYPVLDVLAWIRDDPDVFRSGWLPTVWPAFLWLAPGTVFYTVAKVLQNDLAARGHINICIVACMITLLTMLGLDLMWVPGEGAVGAAKASSIAYVASAAFTLWAYARAGGAPMLDCVIPRWSDGVYVRDLMTAVWDKIRGKGK